MTIRDEAHCISSVQWLITCNQVQELPSKQEADAKIFRSCNPFNVLSIKIRFETFSTNG